MPQTEYMYQLTIVLPLSLASQANTLIANYTGNNADLDTFAPPGLSVNGQEPATHYYCDTSATIDIKNNYWNWANKKNVQILQTDINQTVEQTNVNGIVVGSTMTSQEFFDYLGLQIVDDGIP